jgi:hypothetical protein
MNVEAMVVGGSLGRNEADCYSDLDLFVLVRDEDLRTVLTSTMRTLCDCLGTVLLFRGPVFVEGFGYSFTVLYEPSFISQFNVNTHSTLTPSPLWTPGSLVLFDRTGRYSNLLRCLPVQVDAKLRFAESFTFFWLRALTASRYLKRGNLWATVSLLGDLRNQMMTVFRLARSVHPPGNNYRFAAKGLERQVGGGVAGVFGPTLCSYTSGSISAALLFSVNWFLEASGQYAVEQGMDFHSQLAVATRLKSEITGICELVKAG